jgi:uncharacterized protein (TIGR00296 family)
MEYAYTEEEGIFLVKLARESLTYYIDHRKKIELPKNYPDKLGNKSGVFVTLNLYEVKQKGYDLRGCIGRPYPEQSLIEAVIDSAVDAGMRDPRFYPVKKEELEKIQFEITALTPPIKIEVQTIEKLLDAIEIGRDGLLLKASNKYHNRAGLFLPQVPVEWHWNKEEYLSELCGKAGISSNAWKDLENVIVYQFRGEIFEEEHPNGPILRKQLN